MAAKPIVLNLAPDIGDDLKLSGVFECYQSCEHQQDWDVFLAEKGRLIQGIATYPFAPVDEALLSKLPNVEIVSTYSVGTDHVDIPATKARGIALTNTPDVLTDCVAETAIGILLATTRQLVAADKFVRAGKWTVANCFPLTAQMTNKRVGIVGLGRIGAAIARRLECFGGSIAYWSRSSKPEFPSYTYFASVVDLAKHCDILIAACSLTKETTKIINRQVLDALGPQGFVVNIARGAVIDEAELVKALVEGRIAGAGLDVFEDEPNVPKELFDLDTVVLQPHVGSATTDTRQAMADIVVANLEAHFSGKPLVTPVH